MNSSTAASRQRCCAIEATTLNSPHVLLLVYFLCFYFVESADFKFVGDGCLTFFAGRINGLPKSFDCVDESSLSIAKAINFSKLPVKNYNVKLFESNLWAVQKKLNTHR